MGSNTACTIVCLFLVAWDSGDGIFCMLPADIVEYAERWANEGKIVIIAALDGTFQRKPFKSILELIPLAEEVCPICSLATGLCQQVFWYLWTSVTV